MSDDKQSSHAHEQTSTQAHKAITHSTERMTREKPREVPMTTLAIDEDTAVRSERQREKPDEAVKDSDGVHK